MPPITRSRLEVLAAALLFSTGGAAIKACQLDGWQVAGLRSALGALTLLVLIPGARRGWTWRTALVGLAYAATLFLYVQANKHTTAANAIFLQSTAPLYLLLISPLLLRERVARRDLVTMALLAGGLALFFAGHESPQRTAPDPRLGNALAALSGVCWALTVAGLRWLARTEGEQGGSRVGAAAAAAALGNGFVFLACLPWMLPLGPVAPGDLAIVTYLGVFQIGLAYVFMTRGVRGLAAMEASLLLLLEPVLNTIWAWLVHGEVPGPWSAAGAGIILLTTARYATTRRRRPQASSASASES